MLWQAGVGGIAGCPTGAEGRCWQAEHLESFLASSATTGRNGRQVIQLELGQECIVCTAQVKINLMFRRSIKVYGRDIGWCL